MLIDEALIGVQLSDRISVPTSRTINDQGQMIVPCSFARTGSQLYTAGQLGLVDEAPDKIITVYRDESEVFNADSMDSFRSAPVTIGHPKDASGKPVKVTSVNSKELQVGALEGMPTRDEDTLGGVLVLTAQEAIDTLEEGTQELSAGYTCDIKDVDGKLYQSNIRANHIAIVAKGRAGSSCRISDEALEIQDKAKEEEDKSALVDEALLTDAQAQIVALTDELSVQKELVTDFKESADKAELAVEAMKVELADAKVAASEGVIERCEAIEQARLIADMRDLGDKSVIEIKKMVVTDQFPDKDFANKKDSYFDAMFEILVDTSKGETPMSKILKKVDTHVTVDAKYVDPVEQSRKNMVSRQSKLNR